MKSSSHEPVGMSILRLKSYDNLTEKCSSIHLFNSLLSSSHCAPGIVPEMHQKLKIYQVPALVACKDGNQFKLFPSISRKQNWDKWVGVSGKQISVSCSTQPNMEWL